MPAEQISTKTGTTPSATAAALGADNPGRYFDILIAHANLSLLSLATQEG
jgi:hypothetical protein